MGAWEGHVHAQLGQQAHTSPQPSGKFNITAQWERGRWEASLTGPGVLDRTQYCHWEDWSTECQIWQCVCVCVSGCHVVNGGAYVRFGEEGIVMKLLYSETSI